jgi:hypothetical protein
MQAKERDHRRMRKDLDNTAIALASINTGFLLEARRRQATHQFFATNDTIVAQQPSIRRMWPRFVAPKVVRELGFGAATPACVRHGQGGVHRHNRRASASMLHNIRDYLIIVAKQSWFSYQLRTVLIVTQSCRPAPIPWRPGQIEADTYECRSLFV